MTNNHHIKSRINDAFLAAQFVFGYDQQQILTKNKVGSRSLARHCVAYYLKVILELSYQAIGTQMNRRHASAMHSVKTVKNLVDINYQPFTSQFHKFMKLAGTFESYIPSQLGGRISDDGQVSLYRNGSMVHWHEGELSIVSEHQITKTKVPDNTSIQEFISVVLSLT